MRILIFNWKDLAHPAAGGAEVFTHEVARSLVARGHEVTLFAAAVEGEPDRAERDGVRIVRAGGRIGVYRAARRFWERLPHGSFDVVVDEINTRPFLTPRWIEDTPIVALIHQLAREIWFYETPLPIALTGRYVLEPWWLRAYRDVPAITVSASSAESLRQLHGWRDLVVVPEGHTPHEPARVPKTDRPTLVFLGRLVAMKRPQDAISAFVRAAEQLPDATLWMIGDGPLRERLQADAPASVEFLGRIGRSELLRRLAEAHVHVATAIREGWGLNVSEAAACGTPTVGYAVPGLVDSIPASGGALTEARPEALAATLLDVLSGRRVLQPRVSTVPWPQVADAVERRLAEVSDRRRW